jgi:hypothetical protein
MRAIAVGAIEEHEQGAHSQRRLHLDSSSHTFLPGCSDAAWVRDDRIVFDDSFKRCGERAAGEREPVSGADATVSGDGDGSDGQERTVDGEQRAAGKR